MICEGGGIQLRIEIFHFLPETHTNFLTIKSEGKQSKQSSNIWFRIFVQNHMLMKVNCPHKSSVHRF